MTLRTTALTAARSPRTLMLVVSLVYVAFELVLNARLLDAVGTLEKLSQLHDIEHFGRSVAGVGFAVMVLSVLAGDGWSVRSPLARLFLVAVVAAGAFPQILPEADAHGSSRQWMASGTVLLVAAFVVPVVRRRDHASRYRDLFPRILLVLGVAVFCIPAMFSGQKILFDHYLVEASTGAERQSATHVNLLRRGLRQGIVEIPGVPYDTSRLEAPEEKTFMALLGTLVWLEPNVASLVREQIKPLARALSDRYAGHHLDEQFARYATAREEFLRTSWTPYSAASEHYFQARDDTKGESDRQWAAMNRRMDEQWARYASVVEGAQAEADKGAKYVADAVKETLDALDRCRNSGGSNARCSQQAQSRLENDYRVKRVMGRSTTLMDWCEARDPTTSETVDRIFSALISYGLTELVESKKQYVRCNLEISAITPKVIGAHEGEFLKRSGGLPWGLTAATFREQPVVVKTVRDALVAAGLSLPATWKPDDRAGFDQAIRASARKAADRRWDREIVAMLGTKLAPGLSFDAFATHPAVLARLRQRFGEEWVDGLDFTIASPRQFLQRVIEPHVEARIQAEIKALEAEASFYDDGKPYAVRGKEEVRMAMIPPISLLLSLGFATFALAKNGLGTLAVITNGLLLRKRPLWLQRVSRLLLVLTGVALLVLPPFFVENKFSTSPVFLHFTHRLQVSSPLAALAGEWLIRMQPLIYPLSSAFAQEVEPAGPATAEDQESVSAVPRDSTEIDTLLRAAARWPRGRVRDLQRRLTEMGYQPGPIDGIWGRGTATAYEAALRQQRITVTPD